jgi:hypothetical protein
LSVGDEADSVGSIIKQALDHNFGMNLSLTTPADTIVGVMQKQLAREREVEWAIYRKDSGYFLRHWGRNPTAIEREIDGKDGAVATERPAEEVKVIGEAKQPDPAAVSSPKTGEKTSHRRLAAAIAIGVLVISCCAFGVLWVRRRS